MATWLYIWPLLAAPLLSGRQALAEAGVHACRPAGRSSMKHNPDRGGRADRPSLDLRGFGRSLDHKRCSTAGSVLLTGRRDGIEVPHCGFDLLCVALDFERDTGHYRVTIPRVFSGTCRYFASTASCECDRKLRILGYCLLLCFHKFPVAKEGDHR